MVTVVSIIVILFISYVAELDIEEPEPSISTLLMNFDCKFDPYGAMSTPLYQTATFKQVSLLRYVTLQYLLLIVYLTATLWERKGNLRIF